MFQKYQASAAKLEQMTGGEVRAEARRYRLLVNCYSADALWEKQRKNRIVEQKETKTTKSA
jgi:hypothetical protein